MANINRGFCLFSAVLLIACQEKEELGGDEGRGAGLPSSKETQIGSVDPVDESFEEWVSKVKATEPSSKERGMVLFKMAKDKALPAYRTLKFIVDHKEKDESLIGCSVGIMSRVRKSDPIEALRCYELIRDVPQLKGSLHSIGTELGRQAPVHGLDWLNSQDNSREVYFASVNLGGGFSEYAACHPPEEVEPIFERYLESPLFDGKA